MQGDKIRRRQLRTLMSVDDLVNEVFRLLGKLGERRRTLAFFTSDHGTLLGEHGLFAKRLPYTESVQIPLLLRWPGHVASGAIDDRLVANIDITPTILDAAGVTPNSRYPLDGISLLERHDRPALLLEQYENEVKDLPDWASIRTRSYQYVEYYERNEKAVVTREYYDLESDPAQMHNLLGDEDRANDPAVAALSRRLAAYRACTGSPCP